MMDDDGMQGELRREPIFLHMPSNNFAPYILVRNLVRSLVIGPRVDHVIYIRCAPTRFVGRVSCFSTAFSLFGTFLSKNSSCPVYPHQFLLFLCLYIMYVGFFGGCKALC